jgi:hypothetical protein
MIKLVVSLRDSLPAQPTVIELGNQTFDPTISGTLTRQEDLMLPLVLRHLERSGKPYDLAAIKRLTTLSVQDLKPCTATFFKALGFTSYDAIDVNSVYGSLVMDLNSDIKERYGFDRTFDLVTNNGTGEHIFNQYTVFRNMHQLTKVGGVLLFVLPFHNWLNHGFFNFNPILFGDLAAANGYRVLRLSIGLPQGAETGVGRDGVPTDEISLDWQPRTGRIGLEEMQQRGSVKPVSLRSSVQWLARKLTGRNPNEQASRLPGFITNLAERSANVNVVAALQKTRDGVFAVPLQGMYAGANVESDELRANYKST